MLLDTHVWLWSLLAPERLPVDALKAIEAPRVQHLVVLRRAAHAEQIARARQRQTAAAVDHRGPTPGSARQPAQKKTKHTLRVRLHRQFADLRVQIPDRRLALPAALRSGLREHLIETLHGLPQELTVTSFGQPSRCVR